MTTVSVPRKPPITRLLAEYVTNVHYDRLPAEVIAAAKTALIDWVAVAAVGSRTTRQGKLAAAVARESRPSPRPWCSTTAL